MMPASDLYRIPRADAVSRNSEAARYARMEYQSASLSWMLQARPRRPGLATRIATGIRAALGSRHAPTARSPAQPAPLRSGVAAVHFTGEPAHPHPRMNRPHPPRTWEPTSAETLLLPVLEADPKSELCDCHP